MPVADQVDLRSSSGLSVAGEVEIDAFSNQARLVPSQQTIETFRGAQGLQGEPGEQGPQGDPGLPGPQGPQGVQGLQGLAGLPGADGRDGTDGSDGLPGAAGSQGLQGVQGPQGMPGQDGLDGADGAPGVPGPQGPVGDTGPAGPKGDKGDDGADGNDGLPGPAGPVGPIGPTGATGAQGQAGVPVLVVGADGADGVDGSWGLPGVQGLQGPAGADGVPGAQGLRGFDGQDGADGEGAFTTPGWANSLSQNPRSGANNVFIDPGRFINIGVDGPTTNSPQIRSGDTAFRIAGSVLTELSATGQVRINGQQTGASAAISYLVGGVSWSTVLGNGEWQFSGTGGTSGQALCSNGPGVAPTWQTVSAGSGGGTTEGGLVLSATNHSIEIVTTVAGDLDYEASFIDQNSGNLTPNSLAGSISTATTTTAVTAPGASTQRTLVEMNLLNSDSVSSQVVTVQKDVGGTNILLWGPAGLGPLERLEFTNANGWRVFTANGAEKLAGAGSSTVISEGQVIGLPITNANPGVNSAPIPITRDNIAENIRFGSQLTDSTSAGDTGTGGFPFFEPTTSWDFIAPSTLIMRGAAFSGVAGGGSIQATGRFIRCSLNPSSAPIYLIHGDATVSAARRFRNPFGQNLLIRPGESFFVWDDAQASNPARRVLPMLGPDPLLWDDENFDEPGTGINPPLANSSLPYFSSPKNTYWQGITSRNSSGSLGQIGTASVGRHGIAQLLTGTTSADKTALYRTGAIGSSLTSTNSCIDVGKIVRGDFWIKSIAVADSRVVYVGFSSDVLDNSFGANGAYFIYDTTAGSTWACVTRASSTSTNFNTTTNATTSWVKLSVEFFSAGVCFFINDVPVAWNTTNIPTAGNGVNPAVMVRTLAAAAKEVQVDRIRVFCTEDSLTG